MCRWRTCDSAFALCCGLPISTRPRTTIPIRPNFFMRTFLLCCWLRLRHSEEYNVFAFLAAGDLIFDTPRLIQYAGNHLGTVPLTGTGHREPLNPWKIQKALSQFRAGQPFHDRQNTGEHVICQPTKRWIIISRERNS